MTRKLSIVCLFLVAVPVGCGLPTRKLQRAELIAMESVSRMYPVPSHRVALATFEAMRSELASAEFARDSEFFSGPKPKNPGDPGPSAGQPLPTNFPGVWVEYRAGGTKVDRLLTLGACHFVGKTRTGQAATVEVLNQPGGSTVTVHVDGDADRSVSKLLLDKVADRLAHPANPAGSPEEASTFKAFFGGVESREALPSIRR